MMKNLNCSKLSKIVFSFCNNADGSLISKYNVKT